MQCAPFDPCLLFKTTGTSLDSIAGLATDDVIGTGSDRFQEDEAQANARLTTTKKAVFPIIFLGITINRDADSFECHKPHYIDCLRLLSTLDQDDFRSLRGKLLYIAQKTRSDIAYEVVSLSQVPYGYAARL